MSITIPAGYTFAQQLVVTGGGAAVGGSATVPVASNSTDYAVKLTFSGASATTIWNQLSDTINFSDISVWFSGTQIDVEIDQVTNGAWSSTNITLWFKLQANLAASPATDGNYVLAWGNASPTAKNNLANIYPYYTNWPGSALSADWAQSASTPTLSVSGNVLTFTSTGTFQYIQFASITYGVSYLTEMYAEWPNTGNSGDVQSFGFRNGVGNYALIENLNQHVQSLETDGTAQVVNMGATLNSSGSTYHQIKVARDATGNEYAWYDATASGVMSTHPNTAAMPVQIGGAKSANNAITSVKYLKVRPFTPTEPTTATSGTIQQAFKKTVNVATASLLAVLTRLKGTYIGSTTLQFGNGATGSRAVAYSSVSGTATWYLVYNTGSAWVFATSTDGATWTTPVTVPGLAFGLSAFYYPLSLEADASGNLHLAVGSSNSGNAYYTQFTASGWWTTPIVFTGVFNGLAVAPLVSGPDTYASVINLLNTGTTASIRQAKNPVSGGTFPATAWRFSTPSATQSGTRTTNASYVIELMGTNFVFIDTDNGTPPNLYFGVEPANAVGAGSTVAGVTIVSSANLQPTFCAGLDGAGILHVIYRISGTGWLEATYNGTSWTTGLTLPSITDNDTYPCLSSDTNGTLHLFYCKFNAANDYGIGHLSKITTGAWVAVADIVKASSTNRTSLCVTRLDGGSKMMLSWLAGTASAFQVIAYGVPTPKVKTLTAITASVVQIGRNLTYPLAVVLSSVAALNKAVIKPLAVSTGSSAKMTRLTAKLVFVITSSTSIFIQNITRPLAIATSSAVTLTKSILIPLIITTASGLAFTPHIIKLMSVSTTSALAAFGRTISRALAVATSSSVTGLLATDKRIALATMSVISAHIGPMFFRLLSVITGSSVQRVFAVTKMFAVVQSAGAGFHASKSLIERLVVVTGSSAALAKTTTKVLAVTTAPVLHVVRDIIRLISVASASLTAATKTIVTPLAVVTSAAALMTRNILRPIGVVTHAAAFVASIYDIAGEVGTIIRNVFTVAARVLDFMVPTRATDWVVPAGGGKQAILVASQAGLPAVLGSKENNITFSMDFAPDLKTLETVTSIDSVTVREVRTNVPNDVYTDVTSTLLQSGTPPEIVGTTVQFTLGNKAAHMGYSYYVAVSVVTSNGRTLEGESSAIVCRI